MDTFTGRVIVVTGGGHGIGRRYCETIAEQGGKVVVAELDGVAGEAVAKGINASGGEALAVQVNVADEASVRHLAEEVERHYGRCDGLVNNAAVFATIPISRVRFEEVPLDEWDNVMLVNVKGILLVCRALVPLMRKNKYGRIVNISSGTFWSPNIGRIHYNTSKGAVIGFTRTLAMELAEDNITVNALAPGSTLSEDPNDKEAVAMREKAIAKRAIKRIQVPEDVVGPCLFFLSEASGFVTGQTLLVDGGAAVH